MVKQSFMKTINTSEMWFLICTCCYMSIISILSCNLKLDCAQNVKLFVENILSEFLLISSC